MRYFLLLHFFFFLVLVVLIFLCFFKDVSLNIFTKYVVKYFDITCFREVLTFCLLFFFFLFIVNILIINQYCLLEYYFSYETHFLNYVFFDKKILIYFFINKI